ncbi:MAG: hypothetical protein ABIJ96_06750 [Elusimicrobiota bacterium]
MPLFTPVLPSNLTLMPSFRIDSAPSVTVDHSLKVMPMVAAPNLSAVINKQAEAKGVQGTINTLRETVAVKSPGMKSGGKVGLRLNRLFDGLGQRRQGQDGAVPAVTGRYLRHASGLSKAAAKATQQVEVAVPAAVKPASSHGLKIAAAVLAAALLFAAPTIALAAGAPTAVAASLAYLTAYQPVITAAAAAAGVVYGLIASRGKDGEAMSGAQVLGQVLRFGLLAGAGAYVLMDVTQVLFLGLKTVGITALPAALATAALGQGAFQGKFQDPKTSSADRIMAVFPAVAAALGLSIGVQIAAVPQLLALAVDAMAVTGVASALFAALYQPVKSPEKGPAKMARGYVLQALMSGLALAVTNPYYMYTFAALAAWGFYDVISSVALEVEAHLPESLRRLWRGKKS